MVGYGDVQEGRIKDNSQFWPDPLSAWRFHLIREEDWRRTECMSRKQSLRKEAETSVLTHVVNTGSLRSLFDNKEAM